MAQIIFYGDCIYKRCTTVSQSTAKGWKARSSSRTQRGMLQDRVSALREAKIYERQSYRHILGQPSILDESGGEVSRETSFLVARIVQDGDTDIFATIRYLDRYRIRGRQSAFATKRIVVCDSSPRIDLHADGAAAVNTPPIALTDRRSQRHRPGNRRQEASAAGGPRWQARRSYWSRR